MTELRDGNLLFRGQLKVCNEHKVSSKYVLVDSKAWTTFKQLKFRILAKIIEYNHSQQSWLEKCRHATENGMQNKVNGLVSRKDLKRYKKRYEQKRQATFRTGIHFSTFSISKLWGVSKATAARYLHIMEDMGYISMKERVISMEAATPSMVNVWNLYNKGYSYFRGGRRIVHLGLSIKCLYSSYFKSLKEKKSEYFKSVSNKNSERNVYLNNKDIISARDKHIEKSTYELPSHSSSDSLLEY